MIKNRGAFVVRTSAGKADLEVNEIRAAFIGAETAIQRLGEFRADRTARILSGDIPWSLSSPHILAIHLLPLVSFSLRHSCVINKLPQNAEDLLYPPGQPTMLFQRTFTFDGFAKRYGDDIKRVASYSQLFRNGAIEIVRADYLEPFSHEGFTPLYSLEIHLMDCAERMLKIMRLLDIAGPYYLLIALLNVNGLKVSYAPRNALHRRVIKTIGHDNLILPEVLLENTDISIETVMQSSFDMIWNAAGWAQSLSYKDDGHYLENWRKDF